VYAVKESGGYALVASLVSHYNFGITLNSKWTLYRMGQPADIPEDVLKRLYLDERLSIVAAAQQLGCSRGAVQRRLKKLGIATRSKSEAGLLASPYHRCDFDGDEYEKAYLIGFCKGDIHAYVRGKTSETIRLLSATTKSEQIELFQSLFAPYGHVSVSNPDQRGAVHMNAFVNLSMDFLLDRSDSIPVWVLDKVDYFMAFFAGYVDAEAHIGVHNGYAVFKLDSCDKNIILQSYQMLCAIDEIVVPAPSICAAKGYKNKNGHAYAEEMWRLHVGAKSSLLVLFENLRPYLRHKKRIQDMEAAIQNIHTRNQKQRQKRVKDQA
jgi:hypothetical protein